MNQEKVGKFIKEIRIKNNLTQKEFAEKLGVTFQAVSKWENGKNIPDIALLKEISKIFNVNIDEILEGEQKKKKSNKLYFIIGGIILAIITIIIVIVVTFNNNDHDFEFKQISTSCDNFNITGSMAYNKDKTSIYISSVEFCGNDDREIYESIECKLYENHEGDEKEISSCRKENNITLEEYLKELKISVDNYEVTCDNFSNSELYLEINAVLENNKNIIYNIPITLHDNCSNRQ